MIKCIKYDNKVNHSLIKSVNLFSLLTYNYSKQIDDQWESKARLCIRQIKFYNTGNYIVCSTADFDFY